MPMPLVKIGYLFIRTVAKPVSTMIRTYAKSHPKFQSTCVKLAQFYHRVDVRLRRRLATRSGEILSESGIKPLEEEKAIDLGASFIGEAIIFGVAGIILIADSARSYRAELIRRRLIENQFDQLFQHILELTEKHAQLQAQLDYLHSVKRIPLATADSGMLENHS